MVVDIEHIPDEMKQFPCWVAWKWEARVDQDGEEKLAKVPYNVRNGRGADTTRASTWSRHTVAVKALESGQYAGIGIVFSPERNGLSGVDLDRCRNPETGEIASWAQEIITELASYSEISPSQTGVKIFVVGTLPPGRRRGPYGDGTIEMYDRARFFTVTGAHLEGTPSTIEARSEQLAALHARIWPERPRPAGRQSQSGQISLSDGELIARALVAKNGTAFAQLYNGDWSGYPSQSEAEAALVTRLIFWTRGDADRIDELVRSSGLWREKWDRKDGQYGTYGRRTIANALSAYHGAYYDMRSSTPASATLTSDESPAENSERAVRIGNYEILNHGFVYWRHVGDGAEESITLTNFLARIVADVVRDDGVERTLHFELDASLRGRTTRFVVPADRFTGMAWVAEHLGSGAIVSAGLGAKDRAREAIQTFSTDAPTRHVYTHTGWVVPDTGAPYFAHAGGAIGSEGAIADAMVEVSRDLLGFRLPDPPEFGSEAERNVVRTSLGMLTVAPDRVTFPIFSATYRAPLGDMDASVHVEGQTGEGKSELCALAQQHFGATMSRLHLPASWKSTANALEAIAFAAKDVLLVVDDFCPTGSAVDVSRLHAAADSLFRGAGNGAGRARLRSDTSPRPPKPPRALILSTGEETPRGHSLRARLFVVELQPGDMNWERLNICQRDAASGAYARAMAGYLRYLARTWDEWHPRLADDLAALRERVMMAHVATTHKRTPDVTANLALGLQRFLAYAQDCGAISASEAQTLEQRGWKALAETAMRQAQQQAESEPTHRFLELVSAALASGRAYLATTNGEKPGAPDQAWGWRKDVAYHEGFATEEWRRSGDCIGWLDGEQLYLEPDVAYSVTQRVAGQPLGISVQTLGKRLKQRGLLASFDRARETTKVRRVCEGTQHYVWHLSLVTLSSYFSPDKPDIAGERQPETGGDGSSMSELEPDINETSTYNPTQIKAIEFTVCDADVGNVGSNIVRDDIGVSALQNGSDGTSGMSGSLSKPDTKTRHSDILTPKPDIESPAGARAYTIRRERRETPVAESDDGWGGVA